MTFPHDMVGQTLGHYRIESKLGEGGMGAVWKARDTRLDRFVALKTLPAEKLADQERRRRFVQEAKSASALNHPNIVHIYDIADAEAVPFIAMEYVPGKTLDQLIGRKGLRLGEVLKYAVQIADALARAHSAGIIHRDLKPSNIMVDEHGLVKVLDFGLAKLTETAAGEVGQTATMRIPEGPDTEEGTIVGTVAYMSPEQAEGKTVDARSDIFAFGSMVYEMVTGRRAFHGDSKLSTLSAILKEEPKPVSSVAPDAPRDLEKIIARCLRKDAARRFQHMDDVKVGLEELKEESDSGKLTVPEGRSVASTGRKARRAWALASSAVLILAATAGLLWRVLGPRNQVPAEPVRVVPFTSFPGIERDPAISPDGKQIAFSWNGEKGDNFDIYVKRVDSATPLRLTRDPAVDRCPAWSPDGSQIAFVRFGENSGVFAVPSLGGPERRLTDFFNPGWNDRFLDWSPDGKFLALADSSPSQEPSWRIYLVSLETGERKQLTKELIDDNSPAFSPDGRQVVFVRWESYYVSDLYVVPVVGGEPKRLTFDNRLNRGPVWMPDGRNIVFSSERDGSPALWKIPARGGKAEKIVDAPGRDLVPGVSRQGPEGAPRLAFSESFVDTNIWKMDATGRGASSQLIASTRDEVAPDFSPDGKRIAFASNRSGHWEIWVCDSDGSDARQLTSFRGTFVGSPRWSPDGRQIAFDARPEGNGGIFVINAQGGAPRRVTTEPSNEMVPSWSRDGRWIYFASNRGGGYQIWKMPAEGGSAARVTKKGGFVSQESPDGKFLYYSKRPGPLDPSSGVWRTAVEGGEETQIVERGLERFWVVRENGIYFVHPDESHRAVLEFLPFATRRSTRIATLEKPLEDFLGGLAVSSDGQWILYSQVDSANIDIMLVENFR